VADLRPASATGLSLVQQTEPGCPPQPRTARQFCQTNRSRPPQPPHRETILPNEPEPPTPTPHRETILPNEPDPPASTSPPRDDSAKRTGPARHNLRYPRLHATVHAKRKGGDRMPSRSGARTPRLPDSWTPRLPDSLLE